jgi:Phage integrase family
MYWNRPPGKSTPIISVPISFRRWARCVWPTYSPSTSVNGSHGCSAKVSRPWTIQYCESSILSSIFTTALNDQVTYIHARREAPGPRQGPGTGPGRPAVRPAAIGARTSVRGDRARGRGFIEPNDSGHRYPYGTLSAFNAGRCRCPHCRRALADYRAERRAARGATPPSVRAADEDEHIGRDWFQRMVWRPACEAAGLTGLPRFHDPRHSHAPWLLAGGADLRVMKERLGHASIMTTQRYLHTLPDADESAVEAFSRIRSRSAKADGRTPRRSA